MKFLGIIVLYCLFCLCFAANRKRKGGKKPRGQQKKRNLSTKTISIVSLPEAGNLEKLFAETNSIFQSINKTSTLAVKHNATATKVEILTKRISSLRHNLKLIYANFAAVVKYFGMDISESTNFFYTIIYIQDSLEFIDKQTSNGESDLITLTYCNAAVIALLEGCNLYVHNLMSLQLAE